LPINKTVKNIILVFTILCAVVLIVFSVELILQNRSTEAVDNDDGASSSAGAFTGNSGGSEPDSEGLTSQGNGEEDPNGNAGGDEDERPATGSLRPTPPGSRRERGLPGDMTLVIYTDNELFNREDPEMDDIYDVFTFRGDGTAEFQIRLVAISGDIRTYAGNYLAADFEISEPKVSSEDYIGLSSLYGVMASGVRDGLYYELWVHRFTKPEVNDLGLAFVLIYQNSALKDALYDILDSIEIDE